MGAEPAGAARRRRRRTRWLAAGGLVALLLWAGMHAGTALVVTRDIGPPDAIVMLASHEWERLPATVALAQRYPSSLVLLTMPKTPTKWNCRDCFERARQLADSGIAPTRIVELPDRAANTYEEAVATKALAEVRQLHRVVVVTSPYHTRRALNAFRQVFRRLPIDVGVFPAAPSPANPRRWWLGVYDREYVPYEWAGLLYYRVRYGVALDWVRSTAP